MDLKGIKEALQSLGGLPAEIYNDLFKKATTKAGITLETVVDLSNTILLPIKLLNLKAQSIESIFVESIRRYDEKLKNVDDKDLVQVTPELGLPILDKLTYTKSEELSELYINLLTSASKQQTQGFAHPSFINIINNLSVDEARILEYISKYVIQSGDNRIACIWHEIEDNKTKGTKQITTPMVGIEKELDLLFTESMTFCIQNLEIQGLLLFNSEKRLMDDVPYKILEAKYRNELEMILHDVRQTEGNENKLICHQGYYQLTEYGKKFIAIAVNEEMQKYI
ncbi:Abi-alpha family protein [Gottfriedia sp. NPDC056225]|uniref:Abi-alpha family protein n=1 Tax=Gottfriedia sp. NPDC056225 TaxID=3345751 RepID=UPI0035D5C843